MPLRRSYSVNAFRRSCHERRRAQARDGLDSGSRGGHRSADLTPATAATTKKLRHRQFQFRRRGGGGVALIDPWDPIALIRESNADRTIDPSYGADFSAGVPGVSDTLTIVGVSFRGDR